MSRGITLSTTILALFLVWNLSPTESMLQPESASTISQIVKVPAPLELAGDGKTDQTEAIQMAVDSGQGLLSFPKGKFRITRTIEIPLDQVSFTALQGNGVSQIIMAGPGPAFRFTGTHLGTAAPRTVRPEVWDRERTPMVDGLEIVGEHPEACGIEASGTMQLTISRTIVRKTLHAIRITGRNRNVILSECHLYENSGIGVFLDQLNLHQINIANCHISYNRQGGVVSRLSEIRNLQIGTCDIEGNMGGPGDPPAANIELNSRDSSIGEVTIVGCTIQHGHDADNSANIRIDCGSQATKYTDELRHGNITIADNIFSDVQVNVEIRNVRGLTMTGNTAWQGYERNLILENCSNVVIANNVFERNPRYHYGDGQSAKLGVLIQNCSDCVFSSNIVSGNVLHPASVIVEDCRRMNFSNNSIVDYTDGGIILSNVSDSVLTGLLIHSEQPSPNALGLATIDCTNLKSTGNLIDREQ